MKTIEMPSFLPLINNFVTIGWKLLLLSISAIISQARLIFHVFYLDFFLQFFPKYQQYH